MWRNVLTVYFKEMREMLRDRKTIFFMVVLPTLFIPLLLYGLITFAIRTETTARTEELPYAVFGADALPGLAQVLHDESSFREVAIDSPDAIGDAIKAGKIKFGLIVPDDAGDKLTSGTQIEVRLLHHGASPTSKVEERVKSIVTDYSHSLRSERLAALGFATSDARDGLIEPLVIQTQRTAAEREMVGESVGGMLPYLFIIFCFMGALYPAIDLGAGEKERGTLETLLLAPVSRFHLVLGKFLVVFTSGVTSALLTIGSLAFWATLKAPDLIAALGKDVFETVGVADFLYVAAMLIPLAAIFASLLLTISIYARSFKEAQAYCTPLNLLVVVPAMIAILPGVRLDWYWACVPVTNVSLAIKEIVKGTMDYAMLWAILGSSFALAGALIFFCAKWFEREAVLFRE